MLKFARLFMDGTEINPGPALITNFTKVTLSGTYYQGVVKYGETADNQWMCNSFFALCFSLIKSITVLNSSISFMNLDRKHEIMKYLKILV